MVARQRCMGRTAVVMPECPASGIVSVDMCCVVATRTSNESMSEAGIHVAWEGRVPNAGHSGQHPPLRELGC